ncbi:MAG TPA: hypothetical protein VNO17_08535 [Actinomycetota bacterium]|nr:hypothetical protein [Actinomycetota bacterium]
MNTKTRPTIEHRALALTVRGQIGPEESEELAWQEKRRELDERVARLRRLRRPRR